MKNVLKGKADGTVDIVIKGGIPDKYEKEQLEALGNMPDMPPLSPSDIAAACGEESEKAFWAQWQNDNPNWRQRDDAKELSKIIG